MTKDEEQEILAQVIADVVIAAVAPLKTRIAELESRVAINAAKAYINFRGTYAAGTMYGKGDAVQRQGGLWIALEDTTGVPGGGSAESRSWQLAVKSGGF